MNTPTYMSKMGMSKWQNPVTTHCQPRVVMWKWSFTEVLDEIRIRREVQCPKRQLSMEREIAIAPHKYAMHCLNVYRTCVEYSDPWPFFQHNAVI